jgi:hypothetical protein
LLWTTILELDENFVVLYLQLYQQQQQQLPLQQSKWDQDDLSEGQSAADNYIKNGQPLLSMF